MNSIASDCREASMMEERAYEFRASEGDTVWKGKAVGMATNGRQRQRDQMGKPMGKDGRKRRRQGVCLACDRRKGKRAAARLDAASVARAGLRKRTCNSWKEINHSRLDINNPQLPVFATTLPPPNPATISSLTSFFALSMCVWFFISLLSFFCIYFSHTFVVLHWCRCLCCFVVVTCSCVSAIRCQVF